MPVLLHHLLPEIRREANSPLARQALRQRRITTLLEHSVFGEIRGLGTMDWNGMRQLPSAQMPFLPHGEKQLQKKSEREAEHSLSSMQWCRKGWRDKCSPAAFGGGFNEAESVQGRLCSGQCCSPSANPVLFHQ